MSAKDDLEKHLAAFPGEYRPGESCNSPHNEAWRVWVKRKFYLQDAFSIERARTKPVQLDGEDEDFTTDEEGEN